MRIGSMIPRRFSWRGAVSLVFAGVFLAMPLLMTPAFADDKWRDNRHDYKHERARDHREYQKEQAKARREYLKRQAQLRKDWQKNHHNDKNNRYSDSYRRGVLREILADRSYGNRYRNLPPGIEKQLVRGRQLPPGIVRNGQFLPASVNSRLGYPAYQRVGVYGDDVVVYNPQNGTIVDVIRDVFR